MQEKDVFSPKPVPKPPYRKIRDRKVQVDGVTYQIGIFLPQEGTGSLESRLLRLMEGGPDQ